MTNEEKLCKCLLGFFDDTTAIIDFDYSKRLFVLLLECGSGSSYFAIVKLVSDEPCALYGFDEAVDYYPVQVAEAKRTDFDGIFNAYKVLCSVSK